MVWIIQDGHLAGPLDFTATGQLDVAMPILIFCTMAENVTRRAVGCDPVSVLVDDLAHIRAIAFALPSVSERLSHGEPCFFVGRRPLCYFHDDHNGDGRRSLWCPTPPGVAADLVAAEPARFYAPTPSARGAFRGWVALYLDAAGHDRVDWDEVAALIHDAYRTIAPKRLVAEFEGRRRP